MMTNLYSRTMLLAGVAACVLASPASRAWAADQDTRLEEVVVTAQRREQRLQDVPVSVTAMTTEQLSTKQITDVLTLSKSVPGMASKAALTPLEISVAIRGVTELIPSIAADPAIGHYIDGVYNNINAGSNTPMIDIERVEILKGPQGTLFGRNTIGGAISITTNKPTDQFEGYGEVNVGNYAAHTFTGVINVPVVPGKFDTRFVYQYNEHGGYGENTTLHTPTGTLVQNFARGSARFTPDDNWEVLLSGQYLRASGHNTPANLGYVNTTASLAPGLPPMNVFVPAVSGHPGDLLTNYLNRGYDTASNLDDRFYDKSFGMTGTITGKLNDAVTVKSISGWQKLYYNTRTDFDASPYSVLELFSYPIHSTQWSEELQFYGDAMEGRLTWIAGGFYGKQTGSQVSNVGAVGFLSGGRPVVVNPQGPNIDNESYAGFAQVTYEIIPKVRLTAGIRYTHDKRQAVYHDHTELFNPAILTSTFDAQLPGGAYTGCSLANTPTATSIASCTFRDSVSYSYKPWTVGLDYKPTDDILLYAKVSKGYRSGAFPITGPVFSANPAQNAANLAEFGPVAPENILSPEAGAKLEAFDHRLRVNTAVFYSDYKNIQDSINLPAPCQTCTPINALQNNGVAHLWGGELEATALLQKLVLEGSIGYVHPKYVSGLRVGSPLTNVSKLNWAIAGTYPIDTGFGTLTLSANYGYHSKARYFAPALGNDLSVLSAIEQKGYGLLDARVSFDLQNRPITLSIYCQNCADKKYIVASTNFSPPLGLGINYPGVARLYGASLKYRF
jgi:iron complex outermembrane receptor protein